MRGWRRVLNVAAWLGAVLALAAPALAHPALSGTALVKISPEGEVSFIVRHDALAFALDDLSANISDGPMFELLDAAADVQDETFAEGKDRFESLTHVKVAGRDVPLTLTQWPDRAGLDAWKRRNPEHRLPVKMDFVGHAKLPAGGGSFTIQFPKVMGDVLVTIERPGREPLGFPLFAGEASQAISYQAEALPVRQAGREGAAGGGEARGPGGGAVASSVKDLTWFDVALRYVWLGFTHIVPGGADHMLFVTGLFLLSPRVKALLWQITAFTIAHSVTLTLTTLQIITLPSIVIEPTIAASIAFVGIENLLTTRVHRWRAAVAFVFGLVHGMGFASALSEVGLPTGQLAAGLVAFNVGVECGHLTVLVGLFAALGWARSRPWYRARIAMPLSVVISCIAMMWMYQRIFMSA